MVETPFVSGIVSLFKLVFGQVKLAQQWQVLTTDSKEIQEAELVKLLFNIF